MQVEDLATTIALGGGDWRCPSAGKSHFNTERLSMGNLKPIVLAFIGGAVLSWGVYVPLVHEAATKLGSSLRAFLFVGVAYFLVAVLVPSVIIFMFTDPTIKLNTTPNFDVRPVSWGIAAGVAGAVGALCVIFAASEAGKGGVLYVAPLVFAGAPIINTLATILYFHPVKKMPSPLFFFGLLLAAAGAAMVMIYKPTEDAPKTALATAKAPAESGQPKS